MATEQRPAHSPLGASSAERWMNCPGSVALLKSLSIPETSDEPEYRSLGTTAHAAAQKCLEEGLDAWEVMNETFGKHQVDNEMATAIQTYLDVCRQIMTEHPGGIANIETMVDAPDFHPDFYGTCDWSYMCDDTLYVRDFKYGQGIVVDVEENQQIMYYAFGVLRRFDNPALMKVDLGIVQPRVPFIEPNRKWETTVDYIGEWAESVLKPAMDRTAIDNDLVAGSHCRFCPAKLVCPLMQSLFGAAMQTDPKTVVNLSDDALDRSYPFTQAVKFYLKALEEEAFRRLNSGKQFKSIKLVQKKADRVFKTGAEEQLKVLGEDAYTKPELKTPAQIEKLGQEARDLVKEWAYTPMTGLTVALATDKRMAVKVDTMTEKFGEAASAFVQKQMEELT